MLRRFFLFTAIVFFSAATGCKKIPPPSSPYNGHTTAVFNPDKIYGTVTDVDGNVYRTIVIGNQTWMAENLRVTHYRNGDEISHVPDSAKWSRLVTEAYCTYNNTTDIDTIATFGLLYNWYVVNDPRRVAPQGWRVPTITDWNILIAQLGGDQIAGYRMKEAGRFHWGSPPSANNSSGFTALPGGWRFFNGKYDGEVYYGEWWAAEEGNSVSAAKLSLFSWGYKVRKGFFYKSSGYSIRCVKE